MLHCPSCKLYIEGSYKTCPLCGGDVTGEPQESMPYPQIKDPPNKMARAIRIITLIAATVVIAAFAANILIKSMLWWSLFVAAGVFCAWFTIVVGLLKRSNIMKAIVWQLFIISAVSILWDVFTGLRGWSLDYVYPCICGGAVIAMFILSKVLKMDDRDYIIYFVMSCLFGIVPLVLFFTGVLNVILPSVLCVSVNLFFILFMLLFHWKPMYREINKKLHL